ncbi:5'-nucleotidase [Streptomyces anthocyanicus]|uniref:Secreted 5'-nucleotidase n=1 Tax=Streptomyces coelicolor (strain ATCC BAA-471 / A3(2) / M145) TaxID=100226 RepID=Q9KZU9_STRCO|nr:MULTISPECIES: bifunctional metallophosphatase/5'-nucleotidase [Streptomyces]MDX2930407.1 bifunctional metallophosphatase/5'-nucleotidase [Streptomyces sp. NRRL_B-16638]MDX3322147.1 bifunctional metallophosphatase/5'-nucleotidase [Streptomyces sp. ME03-5684b]MDX3370147.1 bifunctional metallophosphatase/5'-nucleotidase [Streptomyces sp. ME02-6987-2C]MDX3425199.1 bifunctional metallophosphatase/5'-nucleotidase [Streptomyces sp. ME02-6985-2c]MYU43673.1 bifunctional metallophosphatase/5'-nucleot
MPVTAQPHQPRRRRRTSRLLVVAATVVTAGVLAAAALPASASAGGNDRGHGGHGHGHGHGQGRYQDVQLLSFNDLHGNLEPPAGSSGRVTEVQPDGTTKTIDAGGVEYLATHLREARKGNRYSITAAGGDMVGASPLLSGLFHDEPTVEALNKLDLDVTSVGNHEFDEGAKELARLQNGGCHPTEGCYSDKEFKGADYPYLAANVLDEKTGKPLLKPYWVWKQRGVKVGFIGVTLEGTPDIVSAEGVKGLKFEDEVETINKYAKELQRQGVKSIVALIHEGGFPASSSYNYDCDSPGAGDGISGPIVDIAKNITPQVDALVTGHTHNAYVCTIPDPAGNPRMVTSASSFGRLYTDTTLTYDRRTGDIARTSVKSANHVVTRDVPKAPDMTRLIAKWSTLAAPIGNRPIGYVSADINRDGTESPLGDLIADAQFAYGEAQDPETDLALMNPGGIRAPLTYTASGAEGDGVVTYAEGFTVQPFANTVNLKDYTGAQLIQVLKEQVSGPNEAAPKILQVSSGLTYTLDLTRSGADRVVTDSIRLNGAAIDPTATYRVASNSFLAGGGDGFTTLGEGTNERVGADDLAAFEQYLTANSSATAPIAPPAADRITVVR